MNRPHQIWTIVERKYSGYEHTSDTYRYIGAPCFGWDDAYEYIKNYYEEKFEFYNKVYLNNGEKWDLVDSETGEVVGEVIIRGIGAL